MKNADIGLAPMPSPYGTNHENLYVPKEWLRGLAYDFRLGLVVNNAIGNPKTRLAHDAMPGPAMQPSAAMPQARAPQGATQPQGRDQGQKLSRQMCAAIYDVASRTLPPEELQQLETMLRAMCDPNEDRTQQVTADQRICMAADAAAKSARSFYQRYPGAARICEDDNFGKPSPVRPGAKEVVRLAQDSCARQGVGDFFARFPGARRIGRV